MNEGACGLGRSSTNTIAFWIDNFTGCSYINRSISTLNKQLETVNGIWQITTARVRYNTVQF